MKSKRRSRVGPSNPKYAGAVKKQTGGHGADESKMHGGGPHIGRTIEVKAHPSHPGLEFVAPRGRASGKAVHDEALIGAKKHAMKKADAKKKGGEK